MNRGRITIVVFVFLAVLCSACSGAYSENREITNLSDSEAISTSSPPFSTSEPDRYRAVRTITASGVVNSSQTIVIARDGLRRREEYDFLGKRIIYLERPEGHFLLSPSEQLLANLDMTTGDPKANLQTETALAPSSLFFTPVGEPRYRILGREVIDGRDTMKYRVTASSADSTETLIWFDESLGMPIRTEMRSKATDPPDLVIQLKEISFEVDSEMFDLPQNYRLVNSSLILGTKEP